MTFSLADSIDPFRWNSTCAHILSMPASVKQRASVWNQLKAEGIAHRQIHYGVEGSDYIRRETAVSHAEEACLVPPYYLDDTNASSRWHGTVASSIAHLQLLRNTWQGNIARRAKGSAPCSHDAWALVLADDVVLLPGFKKWLAEQMAAIHASNDQVDLVNLAVVRVWGSPVGNGGIAKRVSGQQEWHPWASGQAGPHHVRNPNILVSGYLVRVVTLPTLLTAFYSTQRWGRRCSIDQVLGRIEYASTAAHAARSRTAAHSSTKVTQQHTRKHCHSDRCLCSLSLLHTQVRLSVVRYVRFIQH